MNNQRLRKKSENESEEPMIKNNQEITFHLVSLRNKPENESEEPMIKILRLFLQIGIEEIHVSPSILNNYIKGLYFINQNQYFFEEYEDELMKIFLDIVKISVSTQRNLKKIVNQNGGSKKRGGFKISSTGFILFVTISIILGLTYNYIPEFRESVQITVSRAGDLVQNYFLIPTILGLTYSYIPEFRESVQITGSRAGKLVQNYFLKNITVDERADALNKITEKYQKQHQLLNTRYPNKGNDYERLKKQLKNEENQEKKRIFYFNSRKWKHHIKDISMKILDLLYKMFTEPDTFTQGGWAQTIIIVSAIFQSPAFLGKLIALIQPSSTQGGGSKKKNRTKK